MKVYVIFRVKCDRESSLHFRDGGNFQDSVDEHFMIRVQCNERSYISSIRDKLSKIYNFISVNKISDLDTEIAEEFDSLSTLWENYQDYKEEEEVENDKIGIVNDKKFAIIAISQYTGKTHQELCQFHELIKNNPVDKEFNKFNELNKLNEMNINQYQIQSPYGNYKFNGHSYDSVEGDNHVFIDQLLTSSEKYLIYDDNDNNDHNPIELSTQQCIIVDSIDKPYIMVNKSGLRQLEKFGDIETLKVRIGNENNLVNNTIPPPPPTTTTNTNTTPDIVELMSDIIKSFTNIRKDKIPLSPHIIEVFNQIDNELLPLLISVNEDIKEKEKINNRKKESIFFIIKLSYQYWKNLIFNVFTNWIFNGLFLNVLYSIFRYLLSCLFCGLITSNLGLSNYITFGIVPIVNLFTDNVINTLGKIGNEGRISIFIKIHNIFKNSKAYIYKSIDILFKAITIFCISYHRPIYNNINRINENGNNEEEINQVIEDKWMEGGGIINKVFVILLRIIQDCILLIMTLIPTFADVYERTFREFQQEERSNHNDPAIQQ